ncbi:hypothetical protein PYR71_14250 [Rhizobium sp. MC63]|uniref:Uncharacterized protein n=1 Tax=Rhizobium mulingense TaxID=3031128 RepID=A0ACC6MYS2_9HYPH|nr:MULTISPECIES: hypothetical protein [unclassified Rhizobium]MDF0697646.1 hypothetical protein [Rhizobium sp. MC63]MEA3518494.1 hypothetical protein [Rhizobium sp. MJ31]
MQDKEDVMVSGIPPRHSKSADEPVTIDLEAQDFASAADTEKPVENDVGDTDNSPAEAGVTPETEVASLTEHERAEQVQPEFEGQPGTNAREGEPAAPEPSFTPAPQQHAPRGAGTSGLIAAGIFGGLVALLGAGAIQYAGYLPGTSAPQTTSRDMADLSGEIDGLKQTVANLAANPAGTGDGALETRLAVLEAAAKNPAAATPADSANVEALNQKIAELSGQVDQLRATLAQSSEQQTSNGADIAKRLDEAEKKLNEPRQDVAVARAIAAAALKAAIDRGGPFLAELDTFAGVAPDDPAIADLRSFAETGIPSRTELVRQVPDVATAIVEAVNQPDPNQSWSDRLMASAKSLVTVRPVGNIEGESVEAIAARMEDKVKNGDLPGASAEWNALPAPGKQASAAFKQSLEARIRVEELVDGALSKAVAGTGKEG